MPDTAARCPGCKGTMDDDVLYQDPDGSTWHTNCWHAERGPLSQLDQQADMVNHPPHYSANPSGVECIDVVEHMGFNLGNAIKYIWRADLKGHADEDLAKARWYLDREIARRAKAGA